jgi:RHS repeat-associated protein
VFYAGAQEVETKAGLITVKTYWPHGLGVEIDRPSQPTELNWTHADRLGSPIALTDASGNFREKLAFDAWGKRRTTDGASTPDSLDGQVDNRGFTGHEMLDQLDLVHMNGRVYDPLVARFVSGDPLVQDPTNGQNYSRYSYVFNNPTNLTDPTGFQTIQTQEVRDELDVKRDANGNIKKEPATGSNIATHYTVSVVSTVSTSSSKIGEKNAGQGGSAAMPASGGSGTAAKGAAQPQTIQQQIEAAGGGHARSQEEIDKDRAEFRKLPAAERAKETLLSATPLVAGAAAGSTLSKEAAKETAAFTEVSIGARATRNSANQLNVGLTQSQAIENLAANGYVKTMSKDGTVTIMTNGDKVYRFYPQSTGGGVSGAPAGVPSASVSILDRSSASYAFGESNVVADNTGLRDVMVVGAELPAKVLTRPFEKYLFFDADISSSEAMICGVRDAVISCFDVDVEVQVFASSTRSFLGQVGKPVDWSAEISRLGKANRDSGDAGGLTLVDAKRRWIAYQSRPVDIGLFALDCHAELSGIPGVKESFFDCMDISDWLRRDTPRDADLVDGFGADFLAALVRNYG